MYLYAINKDSPYYFKERDIDRKPVTRLMRTELLGKTEYQITNLTDKSSRVDIKLIDIDDVKISNTERITDFLKLLEQSTVTEIYAMYNETLTIVSYQILNKDGQCIDEGQKVRRGILDYMYLVDPITGTNELNYRLVNNAVVDLSFDIPRDQMGIYTDVAPDGYQFVITDVEIAVLTSANEKIFPSYVNGSQDEVVWGTTSPTIDELSASYITVYKMSENCPAISKIAITNANRIYKYDIHIDAVFSLMIPMYNNSGVLETLANNDKDEE